MSAGEQFVPFIRHQRQLFRSEDAGGAHGAQCAVQGNVPADSPAGDALRRVLRLVDGASRGTRDGDAGEAAGEDPHAVFGRGTRSFVGKEEME